MRNISLYVTCHDYLTFRCRLFFGNSTLSQTVVRFEAYLIEMMKFLKKTALNAHANCLLSHTNHLIVIIISCLQTNITIGDLILEIIDLESSNEHCSKQ